MKTTLYLIRHGETDWNLEGRWQGHADVPLNSLGRRQAQLLARRIVDEGLDFDAIYSSDLARALETAWEVAAAISRGVLLDPQLREIDLGVWSGLTYQEIAARFPDEMARLKAGEDLRRGGTGESTAMLQARMAQFVATILPHHPGERVALVTHGGCIRGLLAHIEGVGHELFQRYPHIGNTSISVVSVDLHGRYAIEAVNDMLHLEAANQRELATAPPDDAEPPQGWTP